MDEFPGKVVLITGSTSGIGAATARQFAQRGATVILNGRRKDRLDAAVEECKKLAKSPEQVYGHVADIESEDQTKGLAQFVLEKVKDIHILVNNAGRMMYEDGPVRDSRNLLPALDAQYALGIRGPYILIHELLDGLIRNKGTIINVSSISARAIVVPGALAYGTAKAGMNHMTRLMAMDLAPVGIRVNTVSPGPVRTEMADAILGKAEADKILDGYSERVALEGDIPSGDDIARTILFLASDASRHITGQEIVVDGGLAFQNKDAMI